MLDLHPEIIQKDGEDHVVLPYDEYLRIKEQLEDAADLLKLRRAKAGSANEPNVPFEEVKRRLGIEE